MYTFYLQQQYQQFFCIAVPFAKWSLIIMESIGINFLLPSYKLQTVVRCGDSTGIDFWLNVNELQISFFIYTVHHLSLQNLHFAWQKYFVPGCHAQQ